MYTVTLIDDEYWALKGLKNSYAWEQNGFQVVAEFSDPGKALSYLEENPTDIVFTDVCMESIDGLRLIEALREDPRIYGFVIVSGYSEFDFVRRSLQLNVFDYLLKPIRRDEMSDLMERLRVRIQQQALERAIISQSAAPERANTSHDGVNRIISFLEKHYAEPITLSKLSKQCYMNETYICDLLRKHLGKTFSVYLQEIRLKNSQIFLRNTNLRISEIARKVGYADATYFCRVFHNFYGITPREYRQGLESGSESSTDV